LGSGLAGENGVTQAADLPGQGQTGSGVPRLLGLRVPEEPIAEIPTDDAHALEAKQERATRAFRDPGWVAQAARA